ncbi:amidase family protein [Marinobacterium marinum]|uniref:Amidase domain-containing protein n=1 Tax=Marinobacterium marinum TaxID=2756129 RepID=A0A7W1X0E6_9GAMM|nr:amidase family protein [Marinobacterium marinum]MBA4503479.1 hypothetical protein [Marinobacterium marinum]
MFAVPVSPFVERFEISPYATGPLDGLSFAIKDNIDIAGRKTGYGSPGWSRTHEAAVAHALCVEQLLGAGGVCKGKTHTDELAYSLLGVNAFSGTPVNPKAPNRVPGGSSSGSAAAVSAGLVDFALGTDTGGSVRFPAANCGVWGYRPSSGAISAAGVLALAPSYDTVGVLAKDGVTLANVMRVLLAETGTESVDDPEVVFVGDAFEHCDASIVRALEDFRAALESVCLTKTQTLSAMIGDDLGLPQLFERFGFLLSTEVWNTFGAWYRHCTPEVSPAVAESLTQYAEAACRSDIQHALQQRARFRQGLNRFLGTDRILCFPTTLDLAPTLEAVASGNLSGRYIPRAMSVNAMACLASAPQITLPVADVEGVPVGLSFLAGQGQDMRLIDVCNRLYARCRAN